MSIVDTTGAAYESIPSHTRLRRPAGQRRSPPEPTSPAPGTAAANGPTQGSIVLFLLDEGVSENRPLKLEIDSEGETGEITLDI